MNWAVFVALGVALSSGRAMACATCGCGDPTLTVMGAEKPFAGRLRAGLTLGQRSDDVGTPGRDRLQLSEQKLDGTVAYAPVDWLVLSLSAPVLHRSVRDASLAKDVLWAVGDVELRAKAIVWQEREARPHHLVAIHGGVKAPTAPRERDATGDLLPAEVQPGTGSWDGLFGASYAFFAAPLSAYVSATALLPTTSADGRRAPRSLRLTALGQYQSFEWLAVRLGAEGRFDTPAQENHHDHPDSGGAIGFAAGDLMVSPTTDVLLLASARVPVLNVLYGRHSEGPFLSLGVVYDL